MRSALGSSPHVRGALGPCPASPCRIRDHPRMCGEHSSRKAFLLESMGSSPHVRGAPCMGIDVLTGYGIIPACAGSTQPVSLALSQSGDHPRMCGEHHVHDVRVGDEVGIIPACAGSTCPSARERQIRRDHPRMCGEHRSCRALLFTAMGSSPHVRGAHIQLKTPSTASGIIPACAGSTLKYLAFLGYSSAFSFGSQGSKLFTCVVFYPPNFRAL